MCGGSPHRLLCLCFISLKLLKVHIGRLYVEMVELCSKVASPRPGREGCLPTGCLHQPPTLSPKLRTPECLLFFIISSPSFKPFANHPKFTNLYFHKNYNPKNRIHSLLPILSALVKIDININCYLAPHINWSYFNIQIIKVNIFSLNTGVKKFVAHTLSLDK